MRKIGKLYNQICTKNNYLLAVDNIKSNRGSMTKGYDKETIRNVLENIEGYYEIILEKLKDFTSDPIRRVYIPKSNGKTRPLGIPTIRDRILQQMFKQVLEPIAENQFHEHSFGFRPNRSAENAIARSSILINRGKMYYCVDIDIKGFFDNINHKRLIKILWKLGIKDKTVLCIIKKMLKAPIFENNKIIISDKGTPQGGILSPLLANIYLNVFDWWINKQWSGIKTRYKYNEQGAKEKSLKKFSKLREVKLVRYADDFKLFCRNKNDADYFFKISKIFLKENLKLDISEEKSKVINLRRQTSEFLGFKINAIKKSCKQTEYVAKLRISNKAINRIKGNLKNTIKEIVKNNGKDRIKKATKYNSIVLGVHNYYRIASHCSIDFREINFAVNKLLYNRLGFPNYTKDDRYRRMFKGCRQKVWNINGVTLFTISYIKSKNPLQYSKNKNKISDKVKLETDNSKLFGEIHNSKDPEWELLKAKIHFLKNGKCYVCNEYLKNNKFNVHHKVPKEYGGTNDIRNLILLRSDIHRELHKVKPDENLLKNRKFLELRKIILKHKIIFDIN